MNYDEELDKVMVVISSDKAIIQPWRNKAKSRLDEAKAFIRMGRTSSNQKTDGHEDSAMRFPVPKAAEGCTCPPLAIDPNCPMHGGQA